MVNILYDIVRKLHATVRHEPEKKCTRDRLRILAISWDIHTKNKPSQNKTVVKNPLSHLRKESHFVYWKAPFAFYKVIPCHTFESVMNLKDAL